MVFLYDDDDEEEEEEIEEEGDVDDDNDDEGGRCSNDADVSQNSTVQDISSYHRNLPVYCLSVYMKVLETFHLHKAS